MRGSVVPLLWAGNVLWAIFCQSVLLVVDGLVESSSSSSSPAPASGLLVVGLGRVGEDCANAALCHFPEKSVFGTIREEKFRQQSQEEGDQMAATTMIRRIPCTTDAVRDCLPRCSHVLLTVQPPRQEDPLNEVFHIIDEEFARGGWIGLISTTGVYGDHQGDWVNEDSELRCSDDSNAGRYVTYENEWIRRAEEKGYRLRIFRCGGIYDNSRSALHTIYKKGYQELSGKREDGTSRPSTLENDVANRIHSTDIARAVLASMFQESPESHRVYNLADDLPESRRVVMDYAYHLFQSADIQTPVFQKSSNSNSSKSIRSRRRKVERKLVSNQRMREELLEQDGLLYPTYREGLNDILRVWTASREKNN